MHIDASLDAFSGHLLFCSHCFVIFVVRATCFYFCFIFIFFLRTSSVGGVGPPDFLFVFSFPCSSGYERDRPPCNIALSG